MYMKINKILFIIYFFFVIFLLYILLHVYIQPHVMTEDFTPKIREFYRPYLRKTRIELEKFTNHYNIDHFVKHMKKKGLY